METQTLALLAVLLLAVILVLLVVVLRRSGGGTDPHELDALRQALAEERDRSLAAQVDAGQLRGRLQSLQDDIEGERRRGLEAQQALSAAQGRIERDAALASERDTRLVERGNALQQLQAQLAETQQQLQAQRESYQQLHGEHTRLQANLQHSQQASDELRAYLDSAKEKLSGAFAELAGKVFEERGQQFEKNVRHATGQSRQDIENLLKPFTERLQEFRGRVDVLYAEEARERASLLGAVGELKTLNQDMASQAAALTNALKGNAKVRGDWGELMLETVLRGSGLEEGVHYKRQQHVVDEEGERLRPDVVVNFPDQRSIVVDSKVNLVAWQEAMNAVTPEASGEALLRHATALRAHVRDLGVRNYPKAMGEEQTLDVTIAFVPIEGALSAALSADPSLQTYAFDNKVVFASPNTLMALLRVAERLWTRDKVQKQALQISDAGGLVLDALMAFLSDFNNVGKKLEDATAAFSNARNRLQDSRHSAISRARRLAELGSKAKKALPPELQPDTVQQLVAPDGE